MGAVVVASLLLPGLSGVTTTHSSDKLFLFLLELQVSQRQLGRPCLPRLAQRHSGRTCDPIHPHDSWRISSEVGCVSAGKIQNQFLGTTRQRESFQRYLQVAQLQNLRILVLCKTLDETGKPFEKCHVELLKVTGEEKIEGGNCSG